MNIFLSHFDSAKYTIDGNKLVNTDDNITVKVCLAENSFTLTMDGKLVKVESDSGLEDLVNQLIKSFVNIRTRFTSTV